MKFHISRIIIIIIISNNCVLVNENLVFAHGRDNLFEYANAASFSVKMHVFTRYQNEIVLFSSEFKQFI